MHTRRGAPIDLKGVLVEDAERAEEARVRHVRARRIVRQAPRSALPALDQIRVVGSVERLLAAALAEQAILRRYLAERRKAAEANADQAKPTEADAKTSEP